MKASKLGTIGPLPGDNSSSTTVIEAETGVVKKFVAGGVGELLFWKKILRLPSSRGRRL